jgi:hypothetical protein
VTAGIADVYGQWLDQLATADPADAGPPPSIADVLEQIDGVDPRVRGLLRYLALNERHEADEADEPGPGPSPSAAPEPDDVDVPDVLRRLTAELADLRARNDDLASALGACYLCWGEDTTCHHCDGRGAPGWRRPDREPFVRCVAPAVKRLRSTLRSDLAVPVAPGDDARPERSTDE